MGIDYVICAAGAGTRTSKINPVIAKPLLKLFGRTLLERSLESLDFFPGDQLIIVVQKEHQISSLSTSIAAKYPFLEIKWVEVSGLTRGQLETAYASRSHWNPINSLVIFNADTFFRSRSLSKATSNPTIDGIIPCSHQPGEAWSFCLTDGEFEQFPLVKQVEEKKRISDWCSVGYYYFRNATDFLEAATSALKGNISQECYVAPIYNQLIKNNKNIVVDHVDSFLPMGSVDQLLQYWNISLENIKKENRSGKIVIDLDNTLTIDSSSPVYSEKLPRKDVIAKMKEYSDLGYEIIIYSARRMKTHNADEGKVLADIGAITFDWLKKHNVPYDSIRFGKPFAENGFYVDDRAIRPHEFLTLPREEILKLTMF